jgi:hypothetical protein
VGWFEIKEALSGSKIGSMSSKSKACEFDQFVVNIKRSWECTKREVLVFSKESFRNKISSQVISEIFCGVPNSSGLPS